MVYKPRSTDEIFESLRNQLTSRIAKLTNFVETSFNYVWTQAFSNRFRDNEVALLAAQLSGWVEYSGGPVTQEDIDALGVDNVTPEELNEFMSDEDLDELVKIVGVERDPGQPATGTVTFETVSSFTQIPAGTSVGTQPDGSGNFFEYTTNEYVESASGETEVDANITAIEVGEEFNVGSGSVTFLPSPPTGVQGVSNAAAILGGANVETNDELRERAKDAIFDKSGGGTADGVRGFVQSETPDVTSVAVAEYPGGNATVPEEIPSPGGPGGDTATTPFADVIVEGGTNEDALESINSARPVAIQHNLVRPVLIEINVDIDVIGTNISVEGVESEIESYLNGRGLGEPVIRDVIIQRVLNADSQVENIDNIDVSVSNEVIEFTSGTDVYLLSKGVQMENDGISEVDGTLNGSTTEFVEDSDYQEIDDDGDTSDDSIDWSLSGDTPDDGTNFFVTYEVKEDIPVNSYEKPDANSVSVTVV